MISVGSDEAAQRTGPIVKFHRELAAPLRDVRLWRERIHKAQQGVG